MFFVGRRVSLNEGPGEIKPLERRDYFFNHPARYEKFYILRTECIGTLYGSQNKQGILPCTALTDWFYNRLQKGFTAQDGPNIYIYIYIYIYAECI
jgi:hypothetical protein